jgi:hypothetical protein
MKNNTTDERVAAPRPNAKVQDTLTSGEWYVFENILIGP